MVEVNKWTRPLHDEAEVGVDNLNTYPFARPHCSAKALRASAIDDGKSWA